DSVQVYDVVKRVERYTINGRGGSVVALTQDDQFFAAADIMGISIFHEGTGKEFARIKTYAADALVFSADGRFVLAGATVGEAVVRRYVWKPDDLVQWICEYMVRNLTRNEWRDYFSVEAYRRTCPHLN